MNYEKIYIYIFPSINILNKNYFFLKINRKNREGKKNLKNRESKG